MERREELVALKEKLKKKMQGEQKRERQLNDSISKV